MGRRGTGAAVTKEGEDQSERRGFPGRRPYSVQHRDGAGRPPHAVRARGKSDAQSDCGGAGHCGAAGGVRTGSGGVGTL